MTKTLRYWQNLIKKSFKTWYLNKILILIRSYKILIRFPPGKTTLLTLQYFLEFWVSEPQLNNKHMLAKLNNNSQNDCWLNNNMLNKIFWAIYTGLLIFRAVADPRNSGISAKSREIPPKKREKPRNPWEIFPNTCLQNIFNTYLGYYICFIHPKRPNLSWNFVNATSKQCPKTTSRFFREFSLKIPRNFAFFSAKYQKPCLYCAHHVNWNN